MRRPISRDVACSQAVASGPRRRAGYSRFAPVEGSTTARWRDGGTGGTGAGHSWASSSSSRDVASAQAVGLSP